MDIFNVLIIIVTIYLILFILRHSNFARKFEAITLVTGSAIILLSPNYYTIWVVSIIIICFLVISFKNKQIN